MFIVTLTEERRLIFTDFPQLIAHCVTERTPRPLFYGVRIWNPNSSDWEYHCHLWDYFPRRGHNFLLVRHDENTSVPHLGFFLRQLEQQLDSPAEVRDFRHLLSQRS